MFIVKAQHWKPDWDGTTDTEYGDSALVSESVIYKSITRDESMRFLEAIGDGIGEEVDTFHGRLECSPLGSPEYFEHFTYYITEDTE